MEEEPIITFIEDVTGVDEHGKPCFLKKMKCSKHGEYSIPHLGIFTFDNCPYCCDEKQRRIENKEKERIENERLKKIEERKAKMQDPNVLRSMGIGSRYFGCRFENWIPENEEPMFSLQTKAKEGVLKATNEHKGTVLLMGGTGTRKTSLAICSLIELGEGFVTTMFECSFRLRADDVGGKSIDSMTGYKFLRFLKTTPVLVIDEVGMTSCTDFDKQWISDVLNARDADNLLTFVISNYPIKELVPSTYKGIVLDDVFGQTVMSRFNHALKFRVSGTDFRTLEKKI